jgi:hypothetical protein
MSHSPTEQELLGRIRNLRREVAPVNDPWPEISARIGAISRDGAATRRGTPLLPFAIAATVLIMAGTLLISGQPWNSPRSFTVMQELTQLYPGAVTSTASEAEYLAAFKEFMTLDRARAAPGLQYVADFDAGWSAMREAEVELKVALSQEPDSLFLIEHMQALRARQLELLQQITAADNAAWRNTI